MLLALWRRLKQHSDCVIFLRMVSENPWPQYFWNLVSSPNWNYWNNIKMILYNNMDNSSLDEKHWSLKFSLAYDALSWFFFFICNTFEHCWKTNKNTSFFKVVCCRSIFDVINNTTEMLRESTNQNEDISSLLSDVSLQPLSSICPDNDPGRPPVQQLPEIVLFIWALISLTVGSCNYCIRLPKGSARSCSPWPVLRGLSPPTSGNPVAEARKRLGRTSCWEDPWMLIWGWISSR